MAFPHIRDRWSTRVLLICAALAAVHLLAHLATVPLLTLLAPLSPPLYGLVAGVHSILPFLARRLTGVPGTALVTASIASVFVAATNAAGAIVVVPLVLAGALIDLVVWRADGSSRRVELRYAAAAVVSGAALFAISLSVFSPEHLTPLLVIGTLAGRIAGELVAAGLSRLLAAALARAGVGRSLRDRGQSRPSS
ncbi:hypothetical protein [Microbacterium sp. 179-I 3D4 NHS]|uniref:hypothetical protein n=1 Tax=Microbacterium sp. 179-I 3D4 NHS TaxID=3142381 RepID=UPI0039A02159